MPQHLNVDSDEPNKMIPHPTYKNTLIVYCNRFKLAEKDEIYRKREQYIQVVGLYDKDSDTAFIEVVCFEHMLFVDPLKEDTVQGLNSTILPTESTAEFMTLIQLAYARAEQVKITLQHQKGTN